ncbi:MAG: DNA polymerase III subunit gamma/tau [Desulfobulbaceae bacterium]|nr:DNA polymerase III subunit gamma/tau [Desulfobulbaceae bacterium]HIJ78469.1 DNA polymerase III subunit gamma/tau [Deltaproteobacteria bacterium]
MSYLVLARKWRPQSFSDVVGQQSVVRTLQNALQRNRVAHAMLFSGVRGVGKTTLARIMAKAMNCEHDGAEVPCNNCRSCQEITAGTAIDLHEIDGASNRGIQEIRELKENIRFFPTSGRYKIIIIDEVHMLTTEAFNALLKTLEEPPAHVFFMFATTELHKIPITILSRCQRYELKRVAFAELVAFFGKIAKQEGVSISERSLEMIAREAEGSVRDGLSLLDQIFSFGGAEVGDDDVVQVLGLVDHQVFAKLARALLAGDLAGCLDIFDKGYGAGMDLKRFANDLLGYFRSLLLCKAAKQPEQLLDVSDHELAEFKEIAAAASQETLYQYFNLLLKGVEEMQYSSRPRMVLEMAFIRATQAGRVVPVADLLTRLDQLLAGADFSLPAAPAAVMAPPVTAEPAPSFAPQGGGARPHPSAPQVAPQKKTEVILEQPVAPRSTTAGHSVGSPGQKVGAAGKQVRQDWDEFIGYVKSRKAWMAHVLRLSGVGRDEGSELVMKFDDPSDCSVMQEHDNLKLINEFAQDFFQRDFKVVFRVRGVKDDGEQGDDGDNPREERRALANDPLVQMTNEIFSGQVGNVRTGPRSR